MSGSSGNLAVVVHQAASRLRGRSALVAGGRGALFGAVAGLAWAVTSAALAIDLLAPAAASPVDGSIAVLFSRVAIPVGITLFSAAAFGLASWFRPTEEIAGARAIDLSLMRAATPGVPASGTDVITSGWLFSRSNVTAGDVKGFEQATVVEAERLAASVDVDRAISLRPGPATNRQLFAAGGCVLASVLVATLLPRQWFGADGPAPKQLAAANLQVDAARALAAAVANRTADLPPKPEANPGADPTTNAPPSAVQRQLAALDELQQELASGAGSKPSGSANSDPKLSGKAGSSEPSTGNDKAIPVTQRAAKALDELAKAVDEQAQTTARAESLLREKLAETKSSEPDGTKQPMAANNSAPEPGFVDAMRKGDYAGATAELDKLEQTWNTMSPEQRQQAAGKLSDLAEQLKAASDRQGRSDLASPSAKQLQDQKPATPDAAAATDTTDSELAKAAARGDAQAIEKELVRQGRAPEDAARTADEAIRGEQAKQQQRAAAEQAKQKTKTLAERLKELSDELKAKQAEKERAGQGGAKPDPAKPDATKPEPNKAEPAKPDEGKPSQAKSDAGKSDQGKSDEGKSDQGKSDQGKPDPGRQGESSRDGQGQPQPGEPREMSKDGQQGQTGKQSSNSAKPSDGKSPGENPAEKTGEPTATDGKPNDTGNRQAQQPDRSKPDSTSRPDSTAKPDSTSKPDATGKPDPAGNPDSAAKPGAAPRADAPVRPDGASKPDANQRPGPSQAPSAPKPDETKPGAEAPSGTPQQPEASKPPSMPGQQPAGTPEPQPPKSPGEPAPAQQPADKPTTGAKLEQTPSSAPQPGQPNQPGQPGQRGQPGQPGQPSLSGEKTVAKPAADQPGAQSPDGKTPGPSASPSATPNVPESEQPNTKPNNDPNGRPGQPTPAGGTPAGKPEAGKSGEQPPTAAKQPNADDSPKPEPNAPNTPNAIGAPGAPGRAEQSQRSGPSSSPPAPTTKPSPTGEQQQSPTTKPSPSPQQQQPGAADRDQKPGSGFAKLREQLEQLQRDKNAPTEAAKDSAELREQARKMLEGMSPAERDEMMKLARDMAAGNKDNSPSDRTPRDGTPEQRRRFGTADRIRPPSQTLSEFAAKPDGIIDARPTAGQMRSGGPQRTLAEWQGQGGKVAPADQGPLQESVRDAAGAAQQAIERQQVPKRMEDLVSRWYRRLPEAMGAGKPAPASPPTSGEPK